MISPPEHIALLSLPMLSLMGVAHRLTGAALGVIGALIPESGNALPPGRIQYTSEAQHYVLPGVRGRLRLQGGIVRVNRPWLLFTGLSERSLACSPPRRLISSDIWRVTLYVGPLRDAVFTLLSITALVGWLVVDHELWDRPRDEIARQQARLFNLGAVISSASPACTPRCSCSSMSPRRSCSHRSRCARPSGTSPMPGTTSPWPGSSRPWEPSAVRWAQAGRTSVWWAGPPTGSVRGGSARTRTGPPPADATRGPRCGPGCPSAPGARARGESPWHPHRSPRPPV